MKQSKKGNQWYLGMKAHVAVDARHKLIHHVVATSGSVHDGKVLPELLHGKETAVWGDAAYSSRRSRNEPPCRLNLEPGVEADAVMVDCG